MKTRWLRLMPFSIFVFAAIILGAVLMSEREPPTSEALIGTQFPATEDLTTLQGDRSGRAPSEFQVVNFFASWCMPCRAEHPALMALAGEDVSMLGVAWKDSASAIRTYLEELEDPFAQVVLDTEGHLGRKVGIQGAPETFILDRAGRILFHWRGPITPDVLTDMRQVLRSEDR